MYTPHEAMSVRIYAASKGIVGAGILISEDIILTCSHVVATALNIGKSEYISTLPEALVRLDFPIVAPNAILKAQVILWQPPLLNGGGDVALLRLVDIPPEGVAPTHLLADTNVWGHNFRAYGFPNGRDDGVYVSGKILGKQATGWIQIEGVKEVGFRIQQGFSGSAIWDEQLNGVVGMIVAEESNPNIKAAYMIPSETLVKILNEFSQRGNVNSFKLYAPMMPTFDQEKQYLTHFISELEARKGVLEYISLSGEADLPNANTYRSLDDEWPAEFAILAEQNYKRADKTAWQNTEKTPLTDIREAIEKHSRFVIIGDPGAGKSTTLRRLAHSAASTRLADPWIAPIPFFLYLPRWDEETTFEDFLRRNWPLSSDPTTALAEGKIWLYLDGLNEMGASGANKAKLLREWLHSSIPPQHVIITCRASDYVDELSLQLPIVLILEMNHQQIRNFTTRYLHEKAKQFLQQILAEPRNEQDEMRSLLQLARNPYLLAALIFVYQNAPDRELPRNNGVLFQRLARSLWERERQKGTPGWIPFEQMEIAFSNLAFAMIDEDMPVDIPLEYALHYIYDEKLLEAAQSANFILVEGNKVRFYHQLMQEYFAAKKLDQVGVKEKLKKWTSNEDTWFETTAQAEAFRDMESLGFDQHWYHHPNFQKWGQVVIALCGIAPNADTIINQLLEIDIFLAAHCISISITASDNIRRKFTLRILEGLQLANTLYQQSSNPSFDREYCRSFINALGNMNDPLAAEELAKYLYSHPDHVVRDDASIGLREMSAQIAIPALIKTLEMLSSKEELIYQKEWAFYEVISTLACVKDAPVEPVLLSLLYSKNANIRAQTVDTIRGKIGQHSSQEALATTISNLLRDLHTLDENVRVFAAEALGKLSNSMDTNVVSELLVALQDSDKNVREAATWALGRLENPIGVSTLLGVLGNSDWRMRSEAAELLGKLASPATISAALRIALRDQDDDVRAFAAEMLGTVRDLIAVPSLLKGLDDPNYSVLRNVVEALGKLGDPRAVPELLKMLRAPNDSVRRNVVEALGRLGDPAAIPKLFKALHDPDYDVRRLVDGALDKLAHSAAIPELLKALHDLDYDVRGKAAEVLGTLGEPNTVPELLKALHDPSESVRRETVRALGKLGNPSAVPELLKILQDPSESVRREAATALGKLGNPSAVPELLKILHDPNESVRQEAAEVLSKLGDTSAVPELLKTLQDPSRHSYYIEKNAAKLLSTIN